MKRAHWSESRFTGLFTRIGALDLRAYDPDLPLAGGTVPGWRTRCEELTVGGAGVDAESARGACLGEALERLQAYALPDDDAVEGSLAEGDLPEGTIRPDRWVLFHPEQYRQERFPFERFTEHTRCSWVRAREALTGAARLVPADMAYLFHPHTRPCGAGSLCPGISTGLSAGPWGTPVLLRGLQELIERDALTGAWWKSYGLEEWEHNRVWSVLDPRLLSRVTRPNLTYRFYRVRTPLSSHVTLATIAGEDREGWLFSAGSACRETRAASWAKSLLEAIQSRHYVRYLRRAMPRPDRAAPATFPEHAVYYSWYRERLEETVLASPAPAPADERAGAEGRDELVQRLGPDRPVLFRSMTPPALAAAGEPVHVLRVMVPGLQPLHGIHALAQLGGPLWGGRPLSEWMRQPPHPFA